MSFHLVESNLPNASQICFYLVMENIAGQSVHFFCYTVHLQVNHVANQFGVVSSKFGPNDS